MQLARLCPALISFEARSCLFAEFRQSSLLPGSSGRSARTAKSLGGMGLIGEYAMCLYSFEFILGRKYIVSIDLSGTKETRMQHLRLTTDGGAASQDGVSRHLTLRCAADHLSGHVVALGGPAS